MVGFALARKAIFGHRSNCGFDCRSDGTGVECKRTAKVVLSFGGSFCIGFQPKGLFVRLLLSPKLKRQSRGDDEKLCK